MDPVSKEKKIWLVENKYRNENNEKDTLMRVSSPAQIRE
jgi:hypothetical protein